MNKLEKFLELGGTKKEILLLVLSGIALLSSILDFSPFSFNMGLDCHYTLRYSDYS